MSLTIHFSERMRRATAVTPERSLISRKDSDKVVMICHPVGNGTEDYLRLLLDDLRKERFDPQVVKL